MPAHPVFFSGCLPARYPDGGNRQPENGEQHDKRKSSLKTE
ncbi:hypothetical protein [Kingella pumchi]|nr:hypothetical protein [Kingella pumchi]